MIEDDAQHFEKADQIRANYETGGYWERRMDMLYYQYVDFIVRTVGQDATSMIDIGTASCPYLEWFDWIPERVSFDTATPYTSQNVTGIQADFLTYDFDREYDVLTCLQVLEHVPNAGEFAQKLLAIAKTVIISVPYLWGENTVSDHLHDPIDRKKLRRWTGRRPNYAVVVEEPFRKPKRLIAVYDRDPTRGFGKKDLKLRVHRNRQSG